MIPSPEYNMSAYMLAIAEALDRHVMEIYIEGDTPASQAILSERVLYVDREVSQAALHKFLEVLRDVQKQAQEQMAQYEFRRRVPDFKVSIKDEEKTDGKSDQAPTEEGARKDQSPTPVQAGDADGGTGDKDLKPRSSGGSKR